MNHFMRIAIIAFLVGLAAPFAISVIAMMISFDLGVWIGKVAVPLSSVSGINDSIVELGNGAIYAIIAVSGAILLRIFGRT